MRRSIGILAVLGSLALAVPAHAQATRTWVSGVGDDANPCSRTAPCKTFAGAISKTAAAGEISCLDPGGFGALTITKAISIACDQSFGGILSSSTTGILVNAAATDTVVIKGLDINGGGTGINGIRVLAAGFVHVEDVIVQNHRGASSNGILIAPTVSMKFAIKRTSVTNNTSGNVGGGIVIRPTSSATVSGTINDVIIDGNAFGIAADGNSGAGGINITVSRSVISASTSSGIIATTNAAGAGVMVAESEITNNATGLNGAGGAAVMRVGLSRISGNTTGVSGTVQSYGTNQLNGNATDGTFVAVPGGLK